jgi:diguanylate cyclase (GGDEF)-like protein
MTTRYDLPGSHLLELRSPIFNLGRVLLATVASKCQARATPLPLERMDRTSLIYTGVSMRIDHLLAGADERAHTGLPFLLNAQPHSSSDGFDATSGIDAVEELARLRGEVDRLKAQVSELYQLAHHDCLTNVPNRRSFLATLDQVIARTARYGSPAAVLFVDVDALKRINDAFGHPAGDEALKAVARLLVSSIRKPDAIGRLGGDEFGIVLEQADEHVARETAARILEVVTGARFFTHGNPLPLSVSVGVAMINPGDNPDSVIKRADEEMYRAKRLVRKPLLAGDISFSPHGARVLRSV